MWCAALPVFLLAAAFLGRAQFLNNHIIGIDAYFHIKLAYLTRMRGLILDFPWAVFSVWRDHFDDKAFLYHLLLLPFTYSDLASGAKWAGVLVGAAGLTSFFIVLGLNRVRFPALWFLLLLASGHWFLFRIDTARPQGFSMLLMMWTVHFLINRRQRALAALSFVYALSYAVALPVALAMLQSATIFLTRGKRDWRTPAIVLGAFLCGLLLSPYFPRNLHAFLFPNLIIPYAASTTTLALGAEFSPITTRQLVVDCLPVVGLYFLAFFHALVVPIHRRTRVAVLFVMAHPLIIATLLMKRFIEYGMPLALLFLAFYFSEALQNLDLRVLFRKRPWLFSLAAAVLLLFLAGLVWSSQAGLAEQSAGWRPYLKKAAEVLHERTAPNEFVFTCDWDDAPQLFFYNDHNRYPVFLDPTFIHNWSETVWGRWKSIARGEVGPMTAAVLRGTVRYGVCTSDFEALRELISNDDNFEIVYEDRGAYVFRVGAEENGEVPPSGAPSAAPRGYEVLPRFETAP